LADGALAKAALPHKNGDSPHFYARASKMGTVPISMRVTSLALYGTIGSYFGRSTGAVSDRVPALIVTMAQTPQTPDLEAQRIAMKKLDFLVGEWSGEASVRSRGIVIELNQSEVAQFKIGGLVLVIEGIGRTKADGSLTVQALGLITFDDASRTYRMRAYNDGRWLETEIKLLDEGKAITWGFSLGDIRTHSVLRINDKGEWTELAEITFGANPPQQLLELTVRRVNR
jgi:hypothetical protein